MASGNYFEYEISRSLRDYCNRTLFSMWFRIPDTQLLRYAVANEDITANTVPSDYIAIHKGVSYLLEAKSSRCTTSYCLGYIRDHQLKSLLEWERCGGSSWFLINKRERGQMEAYAVKPQTIKEWLDKGYKSIKWNLLQQQAMKLDRRTEDNKIVWVLDPLFAKEEKMNYSLFDSSTHTISSALGAKDQATTSSASTANA